MTLKENQMEKIEFYQGDTPRIEIEVDNTNLTDFSLTGYIIEMAIKGVDPGNSNETYDLTSDTNGDITITNASTQGLHSLYCQRTLLLICRAVTITMLP
jgi:hypothetical protein